MKRVITVMGIVSLCALLLGGVLVVCGLAAAGFDLKRLGGATVERTFAPEGAVTAVNMDTQIADVSVCPATDGVLRVEVVECDKVPVTVSLTDGVLTVSQTDERAWYERLLFFARLSVKVYLPAGTLTELSVLNVSGDVSVRELQASRATLTTTSGDVIAKELDASTLSLKTTSGDISLSGVTASTLSVTATSGDVSVRDAACETLTLSVTSGDVELCRAVAEGRMSLSTVSGDIELDACDGGEIYAKATSGDIEGTLLTPKSFDAAATSGEVRVPNTVGGICHLRTTSGDIEIRIP